MANYGPNRPRGERAHFAKLTRDQVILVRKLYRDGQSSGTLAEQFGVTQQSLLRVIDGRAWAHVPGATPIRDRTEAQQLRRAIERDIGQS